MEKAIQHLQVLTESIESLKHQLVKTRVCVEAMADLLENQKIGQTAAAVHLRRMVDDLPERDDK